MDLDTLFDNYVFGWMVSDLEKALEAARAERDAGRVPYGRHFLAMALLQYSEFMGSLEQGKHNLGTSTKRFNHFLKKRMGGAYKRLIQTRDVYGDLRSGLVHHFFVKPYCTIILFNDTSNPFKVRGEDSQYEVVRPADGLGITPKGDYYIVIEQYLSDFKSACQRLYAELTKPAPKTASQVYVNWSDIGTTGGLGDSG